MTRSTNISKLHLFAKDTDAPETIKGFKYLKMLKEIERQFINNKRLVLN